MASSFLKSFVNQTFFQFHIYQLNQDLKDGHHEIDLNEKVFYLKSEVEINPFKIEAQ